MNRAKWFWSIVAAQLVFLTAWAGFHEWVRKNAPTILLMCHTVDPQDIVRGDYMWLRYDIGDAPAGLKAKRGDDVWVLLEERSGHFVVAGADTHRLTPGPGQKLVRGTAEPDWRTAQHSVRIEYGIERYFVPEGRGTPRFKKIEVEASVSPAHRLYIKHVLLDGRRYPQ